MQQNKSDILLKEKSRKSNNMKCDESFRVPNQIKMKYVGENNQRWVIFIKNLLIYHCK